MGSIPAESPRDKCEVRALVLHDEISRKMKQCKVKEIGKVEFTQSFFYLFCFIVRSTRACGYDVNIFFVDYFTRSIVNLIYFNNQRIFPKLISSIVIGFFSTYFCLIRTNISCCNTILIHLKQYIT